MEAVAALMKAKEKSHFYCITAIQRLTWLLDFPFD